MIILLSTTWRAIIAFILLILVFLLLHTKYNRQDEVTIIERLGKFKRMYDEPTLFFIIPFIDRVLDRISTHEIIEARRFSYQQDNEQIKVNMTIRFTVFDPKAYAYQSYDPVGSIIDLIVTAKEHHVSAGDLDLQIKSYGRDFGMTIINYFFD